MADDQLLQFDKNCTIATIGACHKSVLGAFENGQPIGADLSNIVDADVSFVQLLVAASRSAAKRMRPFTISRPSAAVEAAFRRAGVDLASI